MVLHLLRGRVLLVDPLLHGRILGRLLRGVLRIHVHGRLLHLQCVGGLPVSLTAQVYKCRRSQNAGGED